jgi:hypothetical protein
MCKSGKIVNVVLNSNNALAGSTNNNATYNIDWGAILKPNKPYKLHWTYVGQTNTITAATKIAQVQIDFQMETYLNKSSIYGAPTTFTIGSLRTFYLNGAVNYLFADDNNNPPIYLQTRPHSNTFRVQVLTNDATPVAWTDSAGTPVANGNYILNLSFQEMESSDE